jgi:hypothetical protein
VKIRRRRRQGAEAWRGILERFEESGMTGPAFCKRERIGVNSLYHSITGGRVESDQG